MKLTNCDAVLEAKYKIMLLAQPLGEVEAEDFITDFRVVPQDASVSVTMRDQEPRPGIPNLRCTEASHIKRRHDHRKTLRGPHQLHALIHGRCTRRETHGLLDVISLRVSSLLRDVERRHSGVSSGDEKPGKVPDPGSSSDR